MRISEILTIYDIILIVFIVIIALLLIIGFFVFWKDSFEGEKYAVIKIDNQEIQRFSLAGNSRIEKFQFKIDEEESEYDGIVY